jgi:hypothetical protein
VHGVERTGDGGGQPLHLAVDDDGVEALLAAEVLVDDRLRHAGPLGDLLDRGGLVAALGEQRAGDADELLASLLGGHADALAGPLGSDGWGGHGTSTVGGTRPRP